MSSRYQPLNFDSQMMSCTSQNQQKKCNTINCDGHPTIKLKEVVNGKINSIDKTTLSGPLQ